MFSRLKRIGSTPVKYQFALVLKELKLSLPLDNMEILCIWTRGPHRCKSLPAISASGGLYVWDFEDQKKAPMMLNCTLYRESEKKDKNAKRGTPSSPSAGRKTNEFLPKTCDITIKQSLDNGNKTKTIGVVTVDLSQHAIGQVYSKDFDLDVNETKNITAKLSFTLHSRPLTSGPQADVDTVSTMEGMDQSYIDTDSVADFGSVAREHQAQKTLNPRNKGLDSDSDDDDEDDSDQSDDDANGFGTGKKSDKNKTKTTGAGFIHHTDDNGSDDSDSDSDSDLQSPDDILADFGKERKKSSPSSPTSSTAASSSSSTTTASSSSSGQNGKAKQSNGTSTTLGSNHPPELSREYSVSTSRNTRESSPERSVSRKSVSGFGIFKSKDKERDKERLERMRQLEKQVLLSEHAKDEMDEELVHLHNELRKERDKSNSLEQELALHDRNTKEIIDGISLEWGTKVAELQVEVKSLRNRINEMEHQHEKRLNEALRAQSEEQSRMMVISEQEKAQMKRELEQLRARKLAFDRIPLPKHGKNNDELAILQSRLSYYDQQLEEADLTIDDVRKTYHDANTVLMNEVRALEEMNSKLRSALNDSQISTKEAFSKVTVLEAQVKRHNDNRIRMSEVLNKMEVLVSEKEERLTKAHTENDELRLEILKLKKQLNRYQQG